MIEPWVSWLTWTGLAVLVTSFIISLVTRDNRYINVVTAVMVFTCMVAIIVLAEGGLR